MISGLALALAIGCTGCGEGDFNPGKVGNIIESAPFHLDAEYVMLNQDQLSCGVDNDLWDPPPLRKEGEHVFARLRDKGRALNFSDDVSIGDMRQPYVQIRGDFRLAALDVHHDHEGPEPSTKLADVKLGVRIDHTCFPSPLVLMGVHNGNFTQDRMPVLFFRYTNGWQFERIVH